MSNAIETKKVIVDEIADKLKAAKTTVVVDYRGLNVAEVTELRKQLREAGNRLLGRAEAGDRR